MKVEYDAERDLLYIWFRTPGTRAAETKTVAPGVHVDLDAEGRLVGLELLDAAEVIGTMPQVEVALPKVTGAPVR